jgi:hypothetical protein
MLIMNAPEFRIPEAITLEEIVLFLDVFLLTFGISISLKVLAGFGVTLAYLIYGGLSVVVRVSFLL